MFFALASRYVFMYVYFLLIILILVVGYGAVYINKTCKTYKSLYFKHFHIKYMYMTSIYERNLGMCCK